MDSIINKINELKSKIEKLPAGYISKKTINGKIRYYHQWTELGKIKSKYIKDGELEELQNQIETRRKLQKELKALEKEVPKMKHIPLNEFRTKVSAGEALIEMADTVRNFERRDCFKSIQKFLSMPSEPRICVIYGLRRTGKMTMLFQTIQDMSPDELSKTVYIKAKPEDTMAGLNKDLKLLYDNGIRNVFIDEITLMSDFIDSAALLSDVYAAMGMKIVLSGTDSLGFWLAKNQELYDRAYSIHTTFIPFREYSRLLKKDDIDEYIRYGGTLRAGETDFDDEELLAEESAFRSDESTRRYIDTAIDVVDGKEVYNAARDLKLPPDVEHAYPDYGLYPELTKDIAYGFLTRGCPRGCGFCHVAAKEGRRSYKVADLSEFWNGQKYIKLLDPNLLACDEHIELLYQLIDSRAYVDFTQGLDIRLIGKREKELLKQIKVKILHFAWDNPADDLKGKFADFKKATQYSSRKLSVYVLTNYDSTHEQDLYRVYTLRDLGYDPYVMIYDKENAPRRTRLLQRWVNNKRVFKTVLRFEDFDPKMA